MPSTVRVAGSSIVGSGLHNVTVTALPGGGWSGCSGRVPAVRGAARLPVGFSVAGCRVAASGRLISEIRGKVFGKRKVCIEQLKNLHWVAGKSSESERSSSWTWKLFRAGPRPGRVGCPESLIFPFSATMQRTAAHHLPLPSRYMRQSRINGPPLLPSSRIQQQRWNFDVAPTASRSHRCCESPPGSNINGSPLRLAKRSG